MILWGVCVGAFLGLIWPGFGGFGLFMGGFLGGLAALALRTAVRAEIAAAQQKLLPPRQAQQPPTAPETDADWPVTQPEPNAYDSDTGSLQAASQPSPPLHTHPTAPDTFATRPSSPAAFEQPAPIHLDSVFDAAKNWLLGGNTIVRVGLVLLFIGLAFLARYVSDAGLFPIELRLASIGAVGIALLVFGFNRREIKPAFALALQGAGVAVMYLTVFAAFRLYSLAAPLAAFALMTVVCALSCVLALLQNAPSLAIAAFAGGFAVPVLLSSGQGDHVSLFSYYMVLNVAILFIARQRAWRVLNLVGFLATFAVASVWGVLKYTPDNYATTQPFLIGFVLIYVLTAILYARQTPTQLGNAVDSTLVFGTPLIAFGLQAGLVRHFEMGTAFSALGFSALYLGLAAVLARRALASYRLLVECFVALGVVFVTLAVPLALDARWTSGIWALEGAGAFWVGMRQARWMPRAFGLLLQGFAALAFLRSFNGNVSALPLVNPVFIGALLIALPGFALAWWLRKPLPHSGSRWAQAYAEFEAQWASPSYVLAFVFWCAAWMLEIARRVPAQETGLPSSPVFSQGTAQLLMMLAVVVSAALSQRLGHAKAWSVALWPSRWTLPVLAYTLMLQLMSLHRVLDTPAWAVWPLALILHLHMLRHNDGDAASVMGEASQTQSQTLRRALHAGGIWLLTFILADALWFGIEKAELWQTSWASVVFLSSTTGLLLWLALWAGRANQQTQRAAFSWPLNPHASAYYWVAAVPLAVLVFFGALAVGLLSSGRTAPLPYVPLLNPTDLSLALALGSLVLWRRAVLAADPSPINPNGVGGRRFLAALVALGFVLLNMVWLRVAHHGFGVHWNAQALFQSFVVQTGYAILWSLLALGLMIVAHRRVQRTLWLVGAGLLAGVVLKLLLIDLSNVGGAERIIAFIAVGLMMLVVGYFAPLPPRPDALTDTTAPTQATPLEAP